MSRKSIAVAMIVKNEEALLARCLESVKWADAIYIMDTGSRDKTIEVAQRYTDNVYIDSIWISDFSYHQNLVKSRVKEDVIISIDADEIMLSTEEEVRDAVSKMTDVLRVNMIAEGSTPDSTLNFGFGRIFRNTPDIFWCQPVHKHLNIPGEGEPIGNIKIMYGHSPAHNLDPDRSLVMLEKAVADQPDSSRNKYYLGREYLYKRRYQDCIDTLQQYVKCSEWPAEEAEAYLEMGQAYAALGKYQEAADSYISAIRINANFKEAILELAALSTPENAIQWKRLAKTANGKDVLWDRVPVTPNRNQILIAPHNDDEVLFAAYTLMRNRLHVVIVTDSYIQEERGDIGCDAETRRQESIKACALLGCSVSFLLSCYRKR